MGEVWSIDRRRHRRVPMAASVRFRHAASQREFPGRCIDVSTGGMLMYVPVTTPVKSGHAIHLTFGGGVRPEFEDLGDEPVAAKVIRVDRKKLSHLGHVTVGVRFA